MSYLEYQQKTVPTGWRKVLHLNWALILLLAAVASVGFMMLFSVAGGSLRPWADPQIKRFIMGMGLMFFIAFVPQFLRPDMALMPQFGVLIATFVGLAALNALAYALLADRLRNAIGRPAVLGWLTRAGGSALVGMGVMTALLRRPAI